MCGRCEACPKPACQRQQKSAQPAEPAVPLAALLARQTPPPVKRSAMPR